ncbi:MAG: NFACT RNA binding domain-containing protein [Candidatus Baltobacteraceae bacterium]
MRTDWTLIRRIARELDVTLRSGRVREVGLLPDGRLGIRVRARGAGGDTIALDPFAPTPSVTLERDPALTPQPGWPRAIADAILGMRVERIGSRRGDRLLAIDLATRSRFGVLSGYRLVAELVPRFGNVLLLKDGSLVAAAKEFSSSQNALRTVVVGETYTPPPLAEPKPGREPLLRALERARQDGDARAAVLKALRGILPLLPIALAESVLAEPLPLADDVERLADQLLAKAAAVLAEVEVAAEGSSDVFVYRNEGGIAAAHLVALRQFEAASLERLPSLLETFAEGAADARRIDRTRGSQARRTTLATRAQRHLDGLLRDRAELERERADADAADNLRRDGELLYTHLGDVPARASAFVPASEPSRTIALDPDLDAKANAAAIFKRYRKAIARREHAVKRLETLAQRVRAFEELLWEIERAEGAEFAEVAAEFDALVKPRAAAKTAERRRPALEFALADDSRVLVGRSPRGNADLTFRIARPDDWWFHARGIPGAHVVLRIDGRREPTDPELETAAALAAYHSKARAGATVAVDYTTRKHVRKQRDALPGLVWYTHARTLDVTPRATPANP